MPVENLLLIRHRGIDRLELRDIGRVNVICGKNNSGKSSLLEAITDANRHDDALIMTAGRLAQLRELIEPALANYHARDHKSRAQTIEDALAASAGTLVYRSQLEEMGQGVAQFLQNRYQRAVDSNFVATAYRRLFGQPLTALLLPAKRRLEVQTAVSAEGRIESHGQGILTRLFHMKNRTPAHPDHPAFNDIRQAFLAITDGFKFDVASLGNEIRLEIETPKRPWCSADECGLGLQELLVILYFAFCAQEPLLCIEEPESHLHPHMQRRLLQVLRERTPKQFFFATHSNVFLSGAVADRVWLSSIDGGHIQVTDTTSRAEMLSDMGYEVADNLTSDMVILTEGPTDVPVLEELLAKRGTTARYAIRMWPLGGDIMQYLDLSVLAPDKKVVALVDRDEGSNVVRTASSRSVRSTKFRW